MGFIKESHKAFLLIWSTHGLAESIETCYVLYSSGHYSDYYYDYDYYSCCCYYYYHYY